MNANREQPIKDFELTGRWRFTSVSRRFFFGSYRLGFSVSHDCITPRFLANSSKFTSGSMTPFASAMW
jgi:hypothetical protein